MILNVLQSCVFYALLLLNLKQHVSTHNFPLFRFVFPPVFPLRSLFPVIYFSCSFCLMLLLFFFCCFVVLFSFSMLPLSIVFVFFSLRILCVLFLFYY